MVLHLPDDYIFTNIQITDSYWSPYQICQSGTIEPVCVIISTALAVPAGRYLGALPVLAPPPLLYLRGRSVAFVVHAGTFGGSGGGTAAGSPGEQGTQGVKPLHRGGSTEKQSQRWRLTQEP